MDPKAFNQQCEVVFNDEVTMVISFKYEKLFDAAKLLGMAMLWYGIVREASIWNESGSRLLST